MKGAIGLPGFFQKILEEMFFPDAVYPGVYDIDLNKLKEAGIKGLIFDIDNTLKPPGPDGPDERVVGLFGGAREMGFELCLLSNSFRRRAVRFSSGLGVYTVVRARKPSPGGFLKAARLMGCGAREICVIGDQIFTDVLGAKRLGMRAAYTKPIAKKEEFAVVLKRVPERFVLKCYERRAANQIPF